MTDLLRTIPAIRKLAEERARDYWSAVQSIVPTAAPWEQTPSYGKDVQIGARVALLTDFTRPDSRDAVARLMAEGVGCPACKGTGKNGTLPAPDSPRDLPCYDCDGSGYLLPPADIDPLIDSNRGHRLTPAQSAVFVADAYIRWRRGLPIPSVVRCSGTPLPDSMTRHYCIAANGTVTTPDFPPEPK